MGKKPDFEALRAARNKAVQDQLEDFAVRQGWDVAHTHHSFNFNACYCACSTGGPCEHDFSGGYRKCMDGMGAEQVCKRCGMGAMSHTLRTAP